ncbi:MAG: hypothetical protein VYE77_11995 [Planctomycetota bacterium]|nr:hypothetical protein [Planctomycetota bacterium]
MKQFLLLIALIGGGFLGLHLALGGETLATTGPTRPEKAPEQAPSVSSPVRINQGQNTVGLQINGGFRLRQKRSVPTATGSRNETVYDLECQDCTPMNDGRHRLEDVTVEIFDHGVHTMRLTARQALVEIQEDDRGQRSLREDKELALADAILESVPGSKIGPIRIAVGNVRSTIEEKTVSLKTIDDDQVVTVVVGGDRSGTLRGRGLQAMLPKTRGDGPDRLDLVINREPVIESEDLTVRATGVLRYSEFMQSGAALLNVDRDVEVELNRGSALGQSNTSDSGQRFIVRGDELRAWLQRSQKEGGQTSDGSLVWNLLRVTGSPASAQGDGFDLQSPRLTMAPGPSGKPFVITADGGQTDLRQIDANGRGLGAFQSAHPVHLVRPNEWLGAVHRSFGFPGFALGPLNDLEVVVFEGASQLDSVDGVELTADRGLHVYRFQPDDPESDLVAKGFGQVTIANGEGAERIVAEGSSGFRMYRSAQGDQLVLGSPDPAAEQTFQLERDGLRLSGRGACQLQRNGEADLQLSAASSTNEITGDFGEEYGTFQGAGELDVHVSGDKVLAMTATGPDMQALLRWGERDLSVSAPRIEQLAENAWRLQGDSERPSRLQRPATSTEPSGDLEAERIDLFRVGDKSAVIDAHAGADGVARLVTEILEPGNPDANAEPIVVTAQRLQLLPFAVGPSGILEQLTGLPQSLSETVTTTVATPWLLARGSVVVVSDNPTHGELQGEGSLLTIATGSRSTLLVGDAASGSPASIRSRRADGTSVHARGAALRLFGPRGSYLSVLTAAPGDGEFLPPQVTFRDSEAGPDDPMANLLGECQGEIQVLPDTVLFQGPVSAHSLLRDGSRNPEGMHIQANTLTMTRDVDSGEVVMVNGTGGVVLDWPQRHVWADSEQLELDLRWQRCIAQDPESAELRLEGGVTYLSRRLEVYYETSVVTSDGGRIVQRAGAAGRQ